MSTIGSDEKIEIKLKLKVYKANWLRFQERMPKYIEHLEKYINDSGASIATPEESEGIIGEEINFEIF